MKVLGEIDNTIDEIGDIINSYSGESLVDYEEKERQKYKRAIIIITPIVLLICTVILYLHSIGFTSIVPKIILGVAIIGVANHGINAIERMTPDRMAVIP